MRPGAASNAPCESKLRCESARHGGCASETHRRLILSLLRCSTVTSRQSLVWLLPTSRYAAFAPAGVDEMGRVLETILVSRLIGHGSALPVLELSGSSPARAADHAGALHERPR